MNGYICCGKEMIRTEVDDMSVIGNIYVCPYCFSTKTELWSNLDAEEILNILHINKDDIKDFDTISDEELSQEIIRLYEAQK